DSSCGQIASAWAARFRTIDSSAICWPWGLRFSSIVPLQIASGGRRRKGQRTGGGSGQPSHDTVVHHGPQALRVERLLHALVGRLVEERAGARGERAAGEED